jgi:hypothetical protein
MGGHRGAVNGGRLSDNDARTCIEVRCDALVCPPNPRSAECEQEREYQQGNEQVDDLLHSYLTKLILEVTGTLEQTIDTPQIHAYDKRKKFLGWITHSSTIKTVNR